MANRGKATLMTMVGFFFLITTASGQDQRIADSLALIYKQDNLQGIERLKLLSDLAFYETNNISLSLSYAEELIHLAQLEGDNFYLHGGYLQKGYAERLLGNLEEAVEAFTKSLDAAIKADYDVGAGTAYGAIADVYIIMQHYTNAMEYYHKAIDILRPSKDSVALASAIMNAGDAYFNHEQYDSAMMYFEESRYIFNQAGHTIGLAYCLGNMGMVYANTGSHTLAEEHLNEAITILETSGNFHPICFYLISVSDIYRKKGDINMAIAHAERSLELARKYELKQQVSDAHLKLSELYALLNKTDLSFQHYKNHIIFRDSVTNLEAVQKIADLRTEFEVSLRESEIGTLEKERKLQLIYIAIAIILLVLAGITLLYFRQRFHNVRLLAQAQLQNHNNQIKDLLKNHETETLQAMINGKEAERKHLAKELHNHIGSLLATIKVNLNGLRCNNEAKQQVMVELVDQACQDVRNISHELNMGISEDFGLIPALKELISHLQKVKEMTVELSASLDCVYINSQDEILLYRIIQELVSNVLKHAQASELSISLTGFEENNLINILVEDNGDGFELENPNKPGKGMGLDSLEEIVQKLDGEMSIDSTKGLGTTVSIDLPLAKPDLII